MFFYTDFSLCVTKAIHFAGFYITSFDLALPKIGDFFFFNLTFLNTTYIYKSIGVTIAMILGYG